MVFVAAGPGGPASTWVHQKFKHLVTFVSAPPGAQAARRQNQTARGPGHKGAEFCRGLTDKSDQTHFDSAPGREFGRRCAEAYLKLARPPQGESGTGVPLSELAPTTGSYAKIPFTTFDSTTPVSF